MCREVIWWKHQELKWKLWKGGNLSVGFYPSIYQSKCSVQFLSSLWKYCHNFFNLCTNPTFHHCILCYFHSPQKVANEFNTFLFFANKHPITPLTIHLEGFQFWLKFYKFKGGQAWNIRSHLNTKDLLFEDKLYAKMAFQRSISFCCTKILVTSFDNPLNVIEESTPNFLTTLAYWVCQWNLIW